MSRVILLSVALSSAVSSLVTALVLTPATPFAVRVMAANARRNARTTSAQPATIAPCRSWCPTSMGCRRALRGSRARRMRRPVVRPCSHPARTARADQGGLELLRDRALVHLLLSSGMRREEVLTLNRADVEDDWSSSAVIVGKGSKARTGPYPPIFIRLDNHRGQPAPDGERWRLTPQTCWRIVKRYSEPTAIPRYQTSSVSRWRAPC